LDETRALLKQAAQEFDRMTELAKNKIASQSDLDLAESNAKSLQARLARQELDATVAERQVATWNSKWRTRSSGALCGHCHDQGRPAGRNDFPGVSRRRLYPDGHLHHRGHGIAGD